ncbi:MAG: thioredoxin-dependent thiol peroxidase [Gammaproteobacteria bacterium]|nr:thioredoxin-dependent thiol peroxidase [Gammaproteobacteria bacterium]
MLTEGTTAPSFNLPNQNDETMTSDAFSGKAYVVFFYPRDNTSGCTKENIDFNDMKAEFDALGVSLMGVSRDSVKSHEKFANKLELSFPLLADTDEVMCNDYGVLVEKSMYGRKYMGIDRSTFLINDQGQITHIWRKVKVPGHVETVLDAAKTLVG